MTSSMEDYLEAVFMLQQKNGYVRCTDVSTYLGVSKPSVSRAVKELSKMNYLVKKADGMLSLTGQGTRAAEQIYERHCFFTERLISVGVDSKIAEQEACRIEHAISNEAFQKLKESLKT